MGLPDQFAWPTISIPSPYILFITSTLQTQPIENKYNISTTMGGFMSRVNKYNIYQLNFPSLLVLSVSQPGFLLIALSPICIHQDEAHFPSLLNTGIQL